MRKISLSVLIAVFVLVGLGACKKIIKSIFQGIDVPVPSISFTFPAVPFVPPGEVPLPPFTQQFNLDSTVRANTNNVYGAGDVSSVKVKEIVFDVDNANEQNNISNFESARILLSSNTKPDTVTVASINFPDTFATSYTYTPVNPPELKPYLEGTTLNYFVYGKLRRPTSRPLTVKVEVTMRVE